MSELIDKTDAVIHDACTKFSHRLQRATGLTCYFVARIGVGISALSLIASIINYYFPFLPMPTTVFEVVLGSVVLVSFFLRSVACQKADDALGSNVKPAQLLFYMTGPGWRLLWTGLMVIDFFSFLLHAYFKGNPVGSFLQFQCFSL